MDRESPDTLYCTLNDSSSYVALGKGSWLTSVLAPDVLVFVSVISHVFSKKIRCTVIIRF